MKVDVTLAIEVLGDVPAMAREAEALGSMGSGPRRRGTTRSSLSRWPRSTRAA